MTMRLYVPKFTQPSPRQSICMNGRPKPVMAEERLARAIRKKGEVETLGESLEDLREKKHTHDQCIGEIVRAWVDGHYHGMSRAEKEGVVRKLNYHAQKLEYCNHLTGMVEGKMLMLEGG